MDIHTHTAINGFIQDKTGFDAGFDGLLLAIDFLQSILPTDYHR